MRTTASPGPGSGAGILSSVTGSPFARATTPRTSCGMGPPLFRWLRVDEHRGADGQRAAVPEEVDGAVAHPDAAVRCGVRRDARRAVDGVAAGEVLGPEELAEVGDPGAVDLALDLEAALGRVSDCRAASAGAVVGLVAGRDVDDP